MNKLSFFALAFLLACAMGAEEKKAPRLVLPRLPLNLLLSGKFPSYDDNGRIVGGSVVTPNSIPFQVSFQRCTPTCSQYCGGSILDANSILTAAHCTAGILISNFEIVAGEHDLNSNSGKEQTRTISKISQHPSYNADTYANDVSVLTLSSGFTLNTEVAKVALGATAPAVNTALTVSGWGTTSSGGSTSSLLRSVVVNVVDDTKCDTAYAGAVVPNVMLCAAAAGRDSCQGDSGGPLFSGSGASAIQHGIVSWGYGCADPDYPGVYTQVSAFKTWIEAQM